MKKEDIKNILPYIGSLLIIIGVIKLVIFYSYFNVNITYFLDFSEILTLFLNDILSFASILLFTVLLVFILVPKREEDDEEENFLLIVGEEKFKNRIEPYYKDRLYQFMYVTTLMFWVFIYFFKNSQIWIPTLLSIGLLVIVLIKIISLEIVRQLKIKYDILPKIIYLRISYFFIFFILTTIKSAYMEYDLIVNKKMYFGTKIEFNDKIITSDSLNYYIGNTKNYLFIYNQKEDNCKIIPMSEIKMITLKKNIR